MVRVVLVDDVEESRAALGRALRLHGGFDVVAEVGDGQSAIAASRTAQPDLVVVDLRLPDLAGHAVLTGLHRVSPAARLVVYSGSHVPQRSAIARSVDAFPEKTQDRRYLVGLLAGLAERSPVTASVELPAAVPSIAVARRFVGRLCAQWDCAETASDAQLVVTELVTNALVHAGTGCEVAVGVIERLLRVEVVDHGEGMPDVRSTTIRDEAGRGLLLVSVLATAWGAEGLGAGGKRVWAELPLEPVGAGDVRRRVGRRLGGRPTASAAPGHGSSPSPSPSDEPAATVFGARSAG